MKETVLKDGSLPGEAVSVRTPGKSQLAQASLFADSAVHSRDRFLSQESCG